MDYNSVQLYQHTIKEVERNWFIKKTIVAPSLNLVLKGSPLKPVVEEYPVGWKYFVELYTSINPKNLLDNISEVAKGFKCVELRGSQTRKHEVYPIKNDAEKSRLARLIVNSPSLAEIVRYAWGRIRNKDDIYNLSNYIADPINEVNEKFRKNKVHEPINYSEGAKKVLSEIGLR